MAQHLLLGGKAGVFIGDMWVTVVLPPGSKSDYYFGGSPMARSVLDTSSPDGGITITTTTNMGDHCLALPAPSSGVGTETEPPARRVPSVGTSRGTAFTLNGRPGHYFEFTLRDAGARCHPNAVWNKIVGALGDRGTDVRLQLWIVDVADEHLVLGSYTDIETDATTLETIRNIVGSVIVEDPGSQFLAPSLPAGPVAPGWYRVFADNTTSESDPQFVPMHFLLHAPEGWVGSGDASGGAVSSGGDGSGGTSWQLTKGTPGAPDGAVVRFTRIDGIYADPCGHGQAQPVDASAPALANAIAAIPGVVILERSQTRTQFETVEYVAIGIPSDIACPPQDFYLWYDDVAGPHAAPYIGSTLRLWVLTPSNRSEYGRIVFEAETYPGEDPDIESTFVQMLDSIVHAG